jgi:hypothetical protein
MPAQILPIQQWLQTPLPTIVGNVDYERLRTQLIRIDQLLVQSGIQQQFAATTFGKPNCQHAISEDLSQSPA